MSFQKKNEKLDYLSLLLKLLPILVFVLILYFWNRQKLIIEEINNNYLLSKTRFIDKVEIRGNRYKFYYNYFYKNKMYNGSINMNASINESENFMKEIFLVKISMKNPNNSIIIIDKGKEINSLE